MKLFAGSNSRKLNVASVVLTYYPNCLRDPRFAKIRSLRKFSRLQYMLGVCA
ncbi:MAG: hypothetical protein PV344_05280 [Anaplasma sp.]|nr:hypothetical protein [Anaplasma sp.]